MPEGKMEGYKGMQMNPEMLKILSKFGGSKQDYKAATSLFGKLKKMSKKHKSMGKY